MTVALPRVRALALHAAYRCRDSGACCSSGWEIPVEAECEDRLRTAIAAGVLRLPGEGVRSGAASCFHPLAGLPHGARAVLACHAHGRCVFLESGPRTRCAVHDQLGEDALPSACRHFPRVARITPRGVDLSLSHYCPTVAGMLFEPLEAGAPGSSGDPLVQIVHGAPAFPGDCPYEGLAAGEALPPLLRPGVLMGWEGHERWETHALTVIGRASAPEHAVAQLAVEAERVRDWTPAAGPFDRYLEHTLANETTALRSQRDWEPLEAFQDWDRVVVTVPNPELRPASPRPRIPELERTCSLVGAGWASPVWPLRRWLAAKAFASWLPLQGDGIRTSVRGLRAALGVLWAECFRGCAEHDRPLDAELLKQAIRRADLLLVHLADPEALARALSRCERGTW